MLSNVRTLGTDLLLSIEKSYRGTLEGAHHGIATFLLLEDAAIASGDQELANFCAAWLSDPKRIVEDAEGDLAWFAAHPDVALSRAKLRPLRATPASAT